MTLADRIVLMRDGIIEQIGSPDDLYNNPKNTYVAGFIGAPTMNLIPARLLAANAEFAIRFGTETEALLPILPVQHDRYAAFVDKPVTFGLRSEDFSLQQGSNPHGLSVQAEVIEPLGSDTLVFFNLAEQEWVARVPPGSVSRIGESLTLYPDVSKMHLFDSTSGQVI